MNNVERLWNKRKHLLFSLKLFTPMAEPLIDEKSLRRKLIFVNDETPGFSRKRRGRGFIYLDEKGSKIEDEETLQRIKDLVIPPQWDNVWICSKPNGYIQATGRDAKNRKQYIYHPVFVEYRQNYKFQRLPEFAGKLPEIRRITEEHIRQKKWTREKVLALMVRVMDHCGIRIGNRCYTVRNGSYGLSTLRRKHLVVEGNGVAFTFIGKSGKKLNIKLDDPKLSRLIKKCSELPGHEVFRYIDEEGKSQPVDSEEVNEYIREIAGEQFSSKDFRTWTATTLAVYYYEEAKAEVGAHPRRSLETVLVKKVAQEMGNTVAVCRSYYIHPKVLQAVRAKKIPSFEQINYEDYICADGALDEWEQAALELIHES